MQGNRKVPMKILDDEKSIPTICGIQVDPHNYITDLRKRDEIEAKLSQSKINVKYVIPRNDTAVQRK